MNRYTPQERTIIVSLFLTNNRSVVLTQREFRRRFPGRVAPTGQTLRRLATRLEETGSTRDISRSGRPRSGRSTENIAAVAADVHEYPQTSIRRRATQLGINRRSLQRILVNDLKTFIDKVPAKSNMELLQQFQNHFAWCKPDWCFLSMSKETNELLQQCTELPKVELVNDIEEIIKRSKEFPIPFPIDTVRLEKLKGRKPIEKLESNIISTYPVIHERVLLLMTRFLIYKREFGSSIEKALYKDMTIAEFIDRILKKRAVTFMGPRDKYKLLSGKAGAGGWESVGSLEQKPPLILENCLSYDEMKVAAMVFVSGPTACINDGTRKNSGVVSEGNAENDAIIIGLIGPRFQRQFKMDYEDILITNDQNTLENGYGEDVKTLTNVTNNQAAKHMWRQMWSQFYETQSYTFGELTSHVTIQNNSPEMSYTDRYVKCPRKEGIFDNEVYYKRLIILAETSLLEAEKRASDVGKEAFLNIIGCGLGVWKISPHQLDVYILSFLERIRAFLDKDLLDHVTDVNFAYIKPSSTIEALFINCSDTEDQNSSEKRIFFESARHPKGGINVQLEDREPSAKLTGKHAGKLLVMTYPWDGNAHPGNEFWIKKLVSSGDPAAACSSQVAELHNAHINPAVSGPNTYVAGRFGVSSISEYAKHLGAREIDEQAK